MSEWIATDPVGLNRQSLERAAKTALAATFAVLPPVFSTFQKAGGPPSPPWS